MIKTVCLRRFKCFENTTIDLAPFTVLMGENCSGKTSVLQAVALALRVLRERNLIWEKPKGRFRASETGTAYPTLPAVFVAEPKDVFYGKQERGGIERGQKGIEIDLYDECGNVYRLRITSQFGSFNVKCTSSPEELSNSPKLQQLDPLLVSGFVGVAITEERLFPLPIESRLEKGRASEVLRNLLLDTKIASRQRFDKLCAIIRDSFGLELGEVDFNEKKDVFVQANFLQKVKKRSFSLDLASSGSGFLQVLQLLAAIFRHAGRSKVVLLDEPDAHLHPNMQVQMASILRRVAREEDLQIIVATHSTSIIRAVSPDEVVPVSPKRKQCSPLRSPDAVEMEIGERLDNYTAAKAAVAGRLVYVEDHRNDLLLALDAACKTNLFSGVNTIPLLPCEGKDDPVPFRMADALKAVTGETVDIHLIRDRDGLPDDLSRQLQEHAAKKEVNLHLWPFHEIENAILTPDFAYRLCKSAADEQGKPCPSKDEVKMKLLDIMKRALSLARFYFKDKLRDAIVKTARILDKHDLTNPQEAESYARRLAEQYAALSAFDELSTVAPGKEVLREFRNWIQETHKINLAEKRMHDYVREMDPPKAVKEVLQAIGKPS